MLHRYFVLDLSSEILVSYLLEWEIFNLSFQVLWKVRHMTAVFGSRFLILTSLVRCLPHIDKWQQFSISKFLPFTFFGNSIIHFYGNFYHPLLRKFCHKTNFLLSVECRDASLWRSSISSCNGWIPFCCRRNQMSSNYTWRNSKCMWSGRYSWWNKLF